MKTLTIFICLFLVAASAESLSIEERLQQVETQLRSTNTELDRLRKDNVFLKTRIEDLTRKDENKEQRIQQLVEENKAIQIDFTDLKSEVSRLEDQVESQKVELVEAKSKIDDLDRTIQEIQSNCCNGNNGHETTSVNQDLTTFTSSLTDEVTSSISPGITEAINNEIELVDIGTAVGRLAVFKEFNYVAVGYEVGVRIYDLRSKQLIRSLENSLVFDIQPFKQSQLIQSTIWAIKVWNVESGELVRTLQCESCDIIASIALNKDESLMLSGDSKYQVVLWDMTEYKELRRFSGHNDSVVSVLFNEAKGQVISGSQDNTIKVWNMNHGFLIRTLTGHSGSVNKILLDQETGHLYSASADNTIREWDLDSGTELRTFTGHAGEIWDLMWSKDGKRLISASSDNSVRIWSKETGKMIIQLNHNDYLYRLALNLLNGQLMTTTQDNKLIFWPLKP